jgi:hypothetical protein
VKPREGSRERAALEPRLRQDVEADVRRADERPYRHVQNEAKIVARSSRKWSHGAKLSARPAFR